MVMSNTELFDQITYMSNMINSVAARMETSEKGKTFHNGILSILGEPQQLSKRKVPLRL